MAFSTVALRVFPVLSFRASLDAYFCAGAHHVTRSTKIAFAGANTGATTGTCAVARTAGWLGVASTLGIRIWRTHDTRTAGINCIIAVTTLAYNILALLARCARLAYMVCNQRRARALHKFARFAPFIQTLGSLKFCHVLVSSGGALFAPHIPYFRAPMCYKMAQRARILTLVTSLRVKAGIPVGSRRTRDTLL